MLLAVVLDNGGVVNVAEQIGIGHILVHVQRIMRKNPKAVQDDRLVVNLAKAKISVFRIAFGVVIPFDQDFFAVQLFKHRGLISFRAEIPKDINRILRAHLAVPSAYHLAIHLRRIFKRAVFVFANAFFAEMRVGNKIYFFHNNLRFVAIGNQGGIVITKL